MEVSRGPAAVTGDETRRMPLGSRALGRRGEFIKDGPPGEVMDEEVIEDVYGGRVSVFRVNGKRLVMPMLGQPSYILFSTNMWG